MLLASATTLLYLSKALMTETKCLMHTASMNYPVRVEKHVAECNRLLKLIDDASTLCKKEVEEEAANPSLGEAVFLDEKGKPLSNWGGRDGTR